MKNLLNKLFKRNIKDSDALLSSTTEIINNAKNINESYSEDFKQALKNKILEKRQLKPMKKPMTFFNIALTPRRITPIVVTVVILSLVLGSLNFWPRGGKNLVFNPDELFTGFSKLLISPALADEFFVITPTKSDSLGVDMTSSFTINSKEPVDTKLIKDNLKLSPEFAYDLEKVSDTEWTLTPKDPVAPDTIVSIEIETSFVDENGAQKARDFSWAFQIKDSFRVLHSIPRQAGTGVPVNSGIEITFSHDTFENWENYFTISPEIKGNFEKHGRTLVFAPTENMKYNSIYTVTMKKGLPVKESGDTLSADYTFSFETVDNCDNCYNQAWLNIYDQFFEVVPEQVPAVQVSASDNVGQLTIDIYQYADANDFFNTMQERDNIPWWASSKEDFREDISTLKKITSFNTQVKTSGYNEYIEFNQNLPVGFYVAEISYGKDKKQLWIQSSHLLSYVNVTKTQSIVWVNNSVTKQGLKGANIDLIDSQNKKISSNITSNDNGVATFDTPEELINSNNPEDKRRFYFKVSKDNEVVFIPAVPSYSYFDYGYYHKYSNVSSIRDNYWSYVYTDRSMYQPTDTIKFWGLLKERDSLNNNQKNSNYKNEVTVNLYKEGYVDYYYRPILINEQKLTLTDNNTFTGELKINNLRPDYYTLQIKIGDDVIENRYLDIKSYVKPAYQIEITPEKDRAFTGEDVKVKVKASFFEGTPVPGLDLSYETPKETKIITTNELGEVDLTYSTDYTPCENEWGCWPDSAYFGITPNDSELSDINAETNISFYGPKVWLEDKTDYPQDKVGQVKFVTRQVDLEKYKNDQWWLTQPEDPIAPNTKIDIEIIKQTYVEVKTGTQYDFINKVTYETYSYTQKEEVEKKFSVNTDSNGEYTLTQPLEKDATYVIKHKVYDNDGKYDQGRSWLYYFDGGRFYRYGDQSFNYYHFELPEGKQYVPGEEVAAKFLNGEEPMPVGKSNYLYLQLQNGLQEYRIGDNYEYIFNFEERDIPNIHLTGVYFNGTSYAEASTGDWWSPVQYKSDEKKLDIKIKTDKELYQPGDEIEVDFEVIDKNGKGIESEVNLNLVDEAFYALSNDYADPLSNIYRTVSAGSLFTQSSHEAMKDSMGGAEKGGCFAAGTKISMADGTEKNIEDIKIGDKITTFDNPITMENTVGTVAETWKHRVNNYMIVNGHLKVTPEHIVFSNNQFKEAGTLKKGDWMVRIDGGKEIIKEIEIKHDIADVYNFRVDPQHTFFANGLYVHNEKGGGARELFVDAALFQSVKTDSNGKGKVKFTLPDNITSWRVTAQAISDNLYTGAGIGKVPVSLPAFIDVNIGKDYLLEDKPVAKVRAFGSDLNASDQVKFFFQAPGLGVKESGTLNTTAYKSAYFNMPTLSIGKHDITYNLTSEKGNDAVKLPLEVQKSRLQAQVAYHDVLTTNTKVEAKNDLPVTVIISDQGQNQLYAPLNELNWEWGDRIDQILARKNSREMLKKYYNTEYTFPEFDFSKYQISNGGISLLPYSSDDLELSARIAAAGADDFDQESLAQYFYSKLNDSTSNPEQISLSLYGLAELRKPVLLQLNQWLERDDLSVKERIYLAQALFDLGDKEKARSMYLDILKESGEYKEPHIIIKSGKTLDEVFQATMAAAVLAVSLERQEAEGLWKYVVENQELYGDHKNSENLFNLEKVNFLKHALPNLKPSPAKIKYSLFGKEDTIELTGGGIFSLQLSASEVDQLQFLEITGNVGITSAYTENVDIAQLAKDTDISIKREYYVNGKKTNTFKETDLVEVRLYPNFGANALTGSYQITDYLPSGLMPATKLSWTGYIWDCNYWYPWNADEHTVKFAIPANFNDSYCHQDYIKYFARVKNVGEYKAEPTILQSYYNPDYINYSDSKTVTISQ